MCFESDGGSGGVDESLNWFSGIDFDFNFFSQKCLNLIHQVLHSAYGSTHSIYLPLDLLKTNEHSLIFLKFKMVRSSGRFWLPCQSSFLSLSLIHNSYLLLSTNTNSLFQTVMQASFALQDLPLWVVPCPRLGYSGLHPSKRCINSFHVILSMFTRSIHLWSIYHLISIASSTDTSLTFSYPSSSFAFVLSFWVREELRKKPKHNLPSPNLHKIAKDGDLDESVSLCMLILTWAPRFHTHTEITLPPFKAWDMHSSQ